MLANIDESRTDNCVALIFLLYLQKKMKTAKLKVVNVVCGGCSSKLERMLSRIDGIENATIDVVSETLTIEYDPNLVELSQIKEKFIEMGYDIEL